MKKTKTTRLILAVLLPMLFLAACTTTTADRLLDTDTSQVAIRQIQTRAFDTTERKMVLRAIIATLQDLGFVVDKADNTLGSVTATKLNQYALRMTVTVRPRGETGLLVRASAQYQVTPVSDPEPYQQFFAALEKSLFLTAQAVD